jgi:hypothetical protein
MRAVFDLENAGLPVIKGAKGRGREMTFKDLQKLIDSDQQQSEDSPQMKQLLTRLHKKPFYKWKVTEDTHNDYRLRSKDNCCFNHIIGLPIKAGKEYPLFDYERMAFMALEVPSYLNTRRATEEEDQKFTRLRIDVENKVRSEKDNMKKALGDFLHEKEDTLVYPQKVGHLLLLKSAGLGLTTFFLRYIAWLCMKDDQLKGQDIVIITGPREQLSIDLINRLKKLFLPFGITFDTRETTVFLNGVRIRSFPSNNLSAARGLESVAMIFLDEAAFFDKASQSEVVDVIERYAGKSNAKIVLLSTPNRPGDLCHTILSQPFEESFYKVLKLDYRWGENKIYSEEDIRIAKASSSFEREYNLSFSSPEGNVFSHISVDRAVELGSKYPLVINKDAKHSLGCDPGFGSSSFGVCVLEYSDSIIKVVYADEFERSSFNDMVHKIWEIKNMIGVLSNVYIDAANTEFIEAVKQELGENPNWHYIHEKIAWAKKNRLNVSDYMQVVPVSFSQEGASMLSHCKNLIENEDSLIAINPEYDKLISGLKGAIAQEYKLNKSETPYPDLVDAFRLACKFFELKK